MAAAEAPAEDAPAEEDMAAAEAPAEDAPTEEEPAEAGIDLAALVEAGDVRSGSRIWRQCSACHVADQEQNRVGPHLVDVIGREKASVDGFRYSDALTSLEGAWTPDAMLAYIEDPREYAPGNRMSFNGLDDPQDRADILAYLADMQLQNGS
jgi:cytochrome c2